MYMKYYTYIEYHFQEDANDMAAHIDILEAITWKQLQNHFGFYLSITNIALQSFARYLESPEDLPYSQNAYSCIVEFVLSLIHFYM